jgi:hypothetical protein
VGDGYKEVTENRYENFKLEDIESKKTSRELMLE